jgi:replicative DNA helicase
MTHARHDYPDPLPVALEAEQALLGAILTHPSAYAAVQDFLRAEHFGEPVHRRMFEVVEEAVVAGKPFSAITVRAAIGDVDLGGQTVGQYVASVVASVSTVSHARAYGQAVWSAWSRRQLIGVAQDVERMARDMPPDLSPAQLAADAMRSLEEAAKGADAPEQSTIGSAAQKALKTLDRRRATGGMLSGVTFGLTEMDRRTQGMQPGQLVILAGRPGMGKSTVGLSVAIRAAQAGHGVAFFALEMGDEELARRAMADLSFGRCRPNVSYFDIRAARISPEQDQALTAAAEELHELPLVIEQAADLTTGQLLGRSRSISADFKRRGRKLELIVVDHLGLLSTGRRSRGRVEEVSEISRALKVLAKQMECPVMALSQLNRAAETRDNKKPQLSDLRDSGSIEQDADVVIGCYREAYYLRDSDRPEDFERLQQVRNTLELIVLKQRDGEVFNLSVFCDVGANHIADLDGRR